MPLPPISSWIYCSPNHWRPLFWDLAIESVIRDSQNEYYDAFNRAHFELHSGVFVEYMLKVILRALSSGV